MNLATCSLWNASVGVVAFISMVGCTTAPSSRGTVAPAVSPAIGIQHVAIPQPAWTCVDGAVGDISFQQSQIILKKAGDEGVSLSQKLILCVLQGKTVVKLAPAVVQTAGGQTSTLKLDLRNVTDEDGDLIVVEDNRAANDFRADPAKFIAEHDVFAVAVKAKVTSTEGMLK